MTVNPSLGRDALEPFLERAQKGVFVVCRILNPGGEDAYFGAAGEAAKRLKRRLNQYR